MQNSLDRLVEPAAERPRTRRATRAAGAALSLLAVGSVSFVVSGAGYSGEWRVPSRKASRPNPIEPSEAALLRGREVYAQECDSCHGTGGAGDGPNAAEVESEIPSFTEVELAGQPDGALFHKIQSGRDPMPGYRMLLEEQDIWSLIHYLRKLAPPPTLAPRLNSTPAQRSGTSRVVAQASALVEHLASGDTTRVAQIALRLFEVAEDLLSLGADRPSEERASWNEALKQLAAAAGLLGKAQGIDQQRSAFQRTSDAITGLVADFGHGGKEPLSLFTRTERRKRLAWLYPGPNSPDPFGGSAGSARCVRRYAGAPLASEG